MDFEQFRKFHSDLTNYYHLPSDVYYEDDLEKYFRMFRILHRINMFHCDINYHLRFKLWIIGYLYGRSNDEEHLLKRISLENFRESLNLL